MCSLFLGEVSCVACSHAFPIAVATSLPEHKSTIKFVTQRPDRRRQMTTIYRCKFDAFSFGYRYN